MHQKRKKWWQRENKYEIEYLKAKGIQFPDLLANSMMKEEIFLSLMVKTYEVLGGKIDISKVNPKNETSDEMKKMILLGVYNANFTNNDMSTTNMD
ncbi:hypothetical protein LGK97_02045 [Clostridium sp. CS001]|uniref:hypothetical protein n=1 Tax=Clostridium sp. CS001 TaxID=2880648 RepID=UPI001CF1E248|nr:hypothetical protein [Clostridium sp. CS001]MCB2288545.1 hypothetical protein [Clostridium sp. CS001]